MLSLATRVNEKVSPRFHGPFQVLDKRGLTAYCLALPLNCLLHPVFHVSRLKKVVPPSVQPQELPLGLTEDGELHVEPHELLDIRYRPDRAVEVLVQWKDLPNCERSWELLPKLLRQFPTAHLQDKVLLQGGSVRDRFLG